MLMLIDFLMCGCCRVLARFVVGIHVVRRFAGLHSGMNDKEASAAWLRSTTDASWALRNGAAVALALVLRRAPFNKHNLDYW